MVNDQNTLHSVNVENRVVASLTVLGGERSVPVCSSFHLFLIFSLKLFLSHFRSPFSPPGKRIFKEFAPISNRSCSAVTLNGT